MPQIVDHISIDQCISSQSHLPAVDTVCYDLHWRVTTQDSDAWGKTCRWVHACDSKAAHCSIADETLTTCAEQDTKSCKLAGCFHAHLAVLCVCSALVFHTGFSETKL